MRRKTKMLKTGKLSEKNIDTKFDISRPKILKNN